MSMESAKAFMERMKNDEDFRKKVTVCKDNEARMEAVKSEGYNFTVGDLKACYSELEEVDLQRVVGGVCGEVDYGGGQSIGISCLLMWRPV